MIDADDFIEGFLEHAQSKEDIKRYNREYYLKNRKLKGRTIDRSGPVFEQGKGVVRPRPKSAASEQRILSAEKKIQRARAAAKKLPPKKRNAVMRQLVSAQKKLNKLKKGFGSTTKVRVRGIEDFPKIRDVKSTKIKNPLRTKKTIHEYPNPRYTYEKSNRKFRRDTYKDRPAKSERYGLR